MSTKILSWVPTRHTPLALCAIGTALTLQACSPAAEDKTLRISGSSTIAPVMEEIARRYSISHPDVAVEVSAGGSNQGIQDVQVGESDIGMVSRLLKSEETGFETFTIARDGVSLLLHEKNPVTDLSQQQIVDIYTGKVNSWKEVGGTEAPIEVLSKSKNHATASLFSDYFGLEINSIQADQLVGDNQDVMQAVLDNSNAIGYVSIGAAEYNIIHGMPVKLLPLEGVDATIQNVSSGEFPLARPLNLITAQLPKERQKAIIEFALSPEASDIIEAQAFVPTASP